jgi:carboxymethylenebutenolidase
MDHELREDSPKSLQGETITLKTADNKPFQTYAVGPKDAKRGILLIHEWWGLNDHIRGWADRFGDLGYRAIAVDLYDGKVATKPEEARALMEAVKQEEANAKHRTVLNALKAPGRKLATIGWCFGGGQSLQASLVYPEAVSATVIYYGPLITDHTKLSVLKGPMLGIFAKQDASITVEKVQAFESAMKRAGRKLEVYFYDADHAFANPSGNRYNSEAAKAAWEVTRAFLDKHLQ